jgi:hypothetical protein
MFTAILAQYLHFAFKESFMKEGMWDTSYVSLCHNFNKGDMPATVGEGRFLSSRTRFMVTNDRLIREKHANLLMYFTWRFEEMKTRRIRNTCIF